MQVDTLLGDIRKFLSAHGMSESKFGKSAIGDHRLIANLKEGRELRSRTLNKVRNFMLTYTGD